MPPNQSQMNRPISLHISSMIKNCLWSLLTGYLSPTHGRKMSAHTSGVFTAGQFIQEAVHTHPTLFRSFSIHRVLVRFYEAWKRCGLYQVEVHLQVHLLSFVMEILKQFGKLFMLIAVSALCVLVLIEYTWHCGKTGFYGCWTFSKWKLKLSVGFGYTDWLRKVGEICSCRSV